MLLSLQATAQTSADPEIRDSLFQDDAFRQIIFDEMYSISLDVVSDTTEYSLSVRPFFDRLLTSPQGQRSYFVDIIAQATLNNSQSVIDLGSGQSVADQVEFILKTLGIWQGPVNAYIRQRKGVYAFPLDLAPLQSELDNLATTINGLQITINDLESRIDALENP